MLSTGIRAAVLLLGTASWLSAQPVTLGPADGAGLPPADLNRVKSGVLAPDFTLEAHDGRRITLSELRGAKDVILVFYRGHW